MPRIVSAGLTMLLVGQVVLAQTPSSNEYFSLKPKTKWTYKVQGPDVEVVVAGTDKIGNEECTKVDTIVNSKVVASEWYAVRPDGVYRVKTKDDKIEPPVKILANPPTRQDWEVKSKVGNQLVMGKFKITEINEKVSTPAGTFETVVVDGVDMDIAGTKATVKTWYAKGIGIVKLSFIIQDAEPNVLELLKYEGDTSLGKFENAKEDHLKKLQGIWEVKEYAFGGEKLNPERGSHHQWEIKDNKVFITVYGSDGLPAKEKMESTLEIDPTQAIPTIDLKDRNPIYGFTGRYKLDGDKLIVCLYAGRTGRPDSLETTKKDDYLRYVFQRKK